jgi:methylated-DNA-[protein]-cysteine S-methyltransferase
MLRRAVAGAAKGAGRAVRDTLVQFSAAAPHAPGGRRRPRTPLATIEEQEARHMAVQQVAASPLAMLTASSPLGVVGVAAAGGAVRSIVFGHKSTASALASLARAARADDELAAASSDELDRSEALAADVLERLLRYAAGEPVDFSDVPVSLDHLSPFQRRVVKACRAIPRGERRTYGELARAAGSPGAARAVGSVMAGNRAPLVVPCHRVVAAGGRLGGFSAADGLAMKRRLLALEAGALAAPTLF